MRTVSGLTMLVLGGCDPYPSIRWYNAASQTLELKDGRYDRKLEPGTSVRGSTGSVYTRWTVIRGRDVWIYDKRLPEERWTTSKYVTFDTCRNTYVYTFQINSDGAITAVADPFRLPAPRNSPQPEGFPLLPRFESTNTTLPANAVENISHE